MQLNLELRSNDRFTYQTAVKHDLTAELNRYSPIKPNVAKIRWLNCQINCAIDRVRISIALVSRARPSWVVRVQANRATDFDLSWSLQIPLATAWYSGFSTTGLITVCRSCGRVVSNSYGPAVGRVLKTDIQCDGSELSLDECRYGRRSNDDDDDDARKCTYFINHVAVSCQLCHTRAARTRRNPIVPHTTNSRNADGKCCSRSTSNTCVTNSCFIIVSSPST